MRDRLLHRVAPPGVQGQTLTEYALILGFVMLVAVVAVTVLGINLNAYLNSIAAVI